MYYEVIPTKVFKKFFGPENGLLTYASDQKYEPGTVVKIPLGKSESIGIVYQKVAKPSGDFKIKSITDAVYSTPLPEHIIKAIFWLSSYYLTPLAEVASIFVKVPKSTKNTATKSDANTCSSAKDLKIPLNTAQKRAISELSNCKPHTKLLHGVTGSGKTNIYLSLAKKTFKESKSTILLVPEIALTSQLVQIFQESFGKDVFLIHSRQTEKTRTTIWQNILDSTTPKIIIGPRSALLQPIHNLGLIIIDEAHESTYYQESPPKYHTLRLSSYIANTLGITCLFGTATPLVSDYYLAKKNDSLVELKEKAKKSAIAPEIQIVDLKNQANFTNNRYFSDQLIDKIKDNLKNHRQTLIFHNRRGSSPLTICGSCGWQALCPNCFLPLTLHTDKFKLVCHTCGHEEKIPLSCPQCKHSDIIHKGFGTKLLETELKKLFKNAKIARFDADNKKSESLDANYSDVKSGNIDIIIGTQTVAKGLDLPHLATVGIVQADANLSLPDYSAEEHTFHLLTQVLGRIGRGHINVANAVIQTYQPDSAVIKSAITSDYSTFYDYLIKKRKKQHMPPFKFIARLSIVYKTEVTAIQKIRLIRSKLTQLNLKSLEISTITPAFHEHTSSGYVWQIIIKSNSRKDILFAIKSLKDYPIIRITLDPPSLL